MEWEEILEKIKELGFYTFITDNYWKLDKEQLRDLAKEMNYAVYSLDEGMCRKAEKMLLLELNENYLD